MEDAPPIDSRPAFASGSSQDLDAEAARRSAAATMLRGHARSLLRTADRVSLCREDAEDAVQRAAEITLTKAPSIPPARLAAWMHVVTRREALAVRRRRERQLGAGPGWTAGWAGTDELDRLASERPDPIEVAERRERVREAARVLRALKHDQRLALVLKAQGYSYREIARANGWTYTKVNRCLVEARQRIRAAGRGRADAETS